MSLTQIIDLDKLVTIVLNDINSAINDWLQGQPTDEVVLMNRLTAYLSRRRRGCDVGIKSRVSAYSELYFLHRKGKGQKDLYGADLAISIYVKEIDFLKTAFFQLKKSIDSNTKLELKQLKDATINSEIKKRSFVICVDENRTGIRIKAVSDLLHNFNSNSKKIFDTSLWISFTEWFLGWLKCDIGPKSKIDDFASIESAMLKYIQKPKLIMRELEFPEDYLPAAAWLRIFLGER